MEAEKYKKHRSVQEWGLTSLILLLRMQAQVDLLNSIPALYTYRVPGHA